jgi:SAM-dependent methyltransferase
MNEKAMRDRDTSELEKLDIHSLNELHWRKERDFAKKIRTMNGRSRERSMLIKEGYSSVASILNAKNRKRGIENASAGFAKKHKYLLNAVLKMAKGGAAVRPVFLEVGFGSGRALSVARDHGFYLYGIEVNDAHVESAAREYGEDHGCFFSGEVLDLDLDDLRSKVDVIYWNDVMEHIPPDEIPAISRVFHELLKPGGRLLTITPNWHNRPSDITRIFKPPRTEAEGFHLKEYKLSEVMDIFRTAGFESISAPLFATRNKAFFFGNGLVRLKSSCEYILEILPCAIARSLSSAFAMSISLAVKK